MEPENESGGGFFLANKNVAYYARVANFSQWNGPSALTISLLGTLEMAFLSDFNVIHIT